MKWIIGLVVLAILAGGLAFAWPKDVIRDHWEDATVEGLSYAPGRSVTGVGPSMGGNGGVAVTSSYISASYVVIFSLDDGTKWPVDDRGWFNLVHQGQKVRLKFEAWRFRGTETYSWSLKAMQR